MDWIQAQLQLRQKRETLFAAKRELKFLEMILEKRKKYLSKNTSVSVKKNQKPITGNLKEDKEDDNFAKRSPEDELDDLLLSDDFAPELYSDSEVSDGEEEEKPEFYQNRVNNSLILENICNA